MKCRIFIYRDELMKSRIFIYTWRRCGAGSLPGWQKGSLEAPPEALQFRGSARPPGPWQKPHLFRQAKASGLHCRERLRKQGPGEG